MAIKFTATLPIEIQHDVTWVKIPRALKSYVHTIAVQGDYALIPVPPYPNPALERLYKKLAKVKGVTWEKKIEGNMITITSIPA